MSLVKWVDDITMISISVKKELALTVLVLPWLFQIEDVKKIGYLMCWKSRELTWGSENLQISATILRTRRIKYTTLKHILHRVPEIPSISELKYSQHSPTQKYTFYELLSLPHNLTSCFLINSINHLHPQPYLKVPESHPLVKKCFYPIDGFYFHDGWFLAKCYLKLRVDMS